MDGNSSDKVSFHDTIQKVNRFKAQLNLDADFKWVADSALYTKERLLQNNDYVWVTRVPETIGEARELVEKPDEEMSWCDVGEGYRISSVCSSYGDIHQRWLLVFSEQAYEREKKTVERNEKKQAASLEKVLWHLGKDVFCCEKDAFDALDTIAKKYPLFTIEGTVVAQRKYPRKGKPKVDDEKVISGYEIKATWRKNDAAISKLLNKKGRFILATNDMDTNTYPDSKILADYKGQQNVERGFRFIKDPCWFMVDSIFLKSPKRIQALMMVMTLCLLVYNVAQYQLRESLNDNSDTLPNQLGKPITNPTLRWVFQLMEGIGGIVRFFSETMAGPVKEWVTNLSALRKKIIMYFGQTACAMYGLIQKNVIGV